MEIKHYKLLNPLLGCLFNALLIYYNLVKSLNCFHLTVNINTDSKL